MRVIRVSLVLLGLLSCSCATVEPYEREQLSHRRMLVQPDPLWAEIEQHTHDYREGAAGGLGGAGGGCGCN